MESLLAESTLTRKELAELRLPQTPLLKADNPTPKEPWVKKHSASFTMISCLLGSGIVLGIANMRIPGEADHDSEPMAITVPK